MCLVLCLAVLAKETSARCLAGMFFYKGDIAARAGFFSMRLPVFLQHICFFPFQKIEAVIAYFVDEFGKLFWRKFSYFGFRMNAYSKQHFIFDNIPCARKNILVKYSVANHHFRLAL